MGERVTSIGLGPGRAAALFSVSARASRAIALVDVVESVRLMEADEAGFVSRWLSFVDHVKTELLPRFAGRFVKGLGDGMLLDFEDARDAVGAAFAIQEASGREGLRIPRDQQIHLRVGIETGDVILEDSDVYGRGVNRAARLVTLAGPGQVVISANVRDRLTADLDADIEDLGECYLKHVRSPVRAYRIGPPGVDWAPALGGQDLLPSLAVIPFWTRCPGDDHHMMGEVIAEELIRELSRSPDMHVTSRLSTTAFRGRGASLAEIASVLHANYVVSGAYRVSGQSMVVDVELAETKSGRLVWTKRHKSKLASVLSGRQDLTQHLVSDVSAAVMSRELERAQAQALPTLESYTLLIGAIALMHRLSAADFEHARQLLETLLERAPRQAIPQAWFAKWYVLRVQQGWSQDPQHDAQLALQCTKRALESDPRCSLALAVDGFVHTNLLKRLDTGRDRYEEALFSNPNDPLAWSLKGTLHAFMGDGASAVNCTRRALRLSPLDPHRYFYDALAATAYLSAHQYDRALEAAKRSLRANRTHTSTLRALLAAQWQLGATEDAAKTVKELLRLEPSLTVSRWLERSPSAAYPIGQEWARIFRAAGVPN